MITLLLHRTMQQRQQSAPARRYWRRYAIAAGLLLAVGTIGLIWYGASNHTPFATVVSGRVLLAGREPSKVWSGQAFDVPQTSPVSLRLADQSMVNLDGGSRAAFLKPEPGTRAVINLIAGAGTFDVTHGNDQFLVQTPIGHVQVVGTRFEVGIVASGDMRVVVSQGSARVFCGQMETLLTKDDQAQSFALLSDGRGGPVVFGTIAGIDLTTRRLQLDGGSAPGYTLSKTVQVTIDGAPTSLNALRSRMNVSLVLATPSRSEVYAVRAMSN